MAGKFFSLEEAAEKLGMTPEQVNEARSGGKIHGYRDGASWKFKAEELERAVSEMGALAGDSGPLAFEDDLDDLLSLEPEGGSDVKEEPVADQDSASGTAIGRESAAGASDVDLVPSESDLDLEAISDLTLEPASDLELAGISDLEGGSDVLSGSGKVLEGGGGEVELTGSDAASKSDALDFGGGSDLELGGDDDELVLEGSGVGSDLSLGSGDTGINIAEPSESGLSLEEEPLELEGSSASSLELPEDDDVISLESDLADPDDATQLKPDEDFQLSPSIEDALDESDSGSQVIALEDSEAFDEDAATMLRPTEEMLVAQDPDALVAAEETADFGIPGAAMAPQLSSAMAPAELPETPYSIWNVLSLMLISISLMICGMLMVDVVRNMWSWHSSYSATTSLMDSFIQALGL